MNDVFIFGFGLAVTALIGTALTIVIVAKNRALEADDSHDDARTEPLRVRSGE